MTSSRRINWLLILQGWAMLWVVIGHAGPEANLELYPGYATFIYETAYSFHMPLFIAISGFLFHITRVSKPEWTFASTIAEKLKRFGIPFLVFTIAGIFMKHFFSSSVERPTNLSLGEFFNAVLYPNEGPMREFWFIATIMWYFAMLPLWRSLLGRRTLQLIFLAASVLLHCYHPDTKFLAIDSACNYLVFFFSGLWAGEAYGKETDYIANVKSMTLLITMSVFIAVYSISRYFEADLPEAFSGIIFSTCLAILLDRTVPQAFSSFRNYTYQIFLMGIFFQVFIRLMKERFGLPFLPMYVLSVAAGLYAPVLISIIISKINFKPLGLCIGLKS